MSAIDGSKNRISYIDLLKFFAIASVILGHCTEQITGNDFWSNPIWSTIYTYHMPLFMMVCGYFFGSSLDRPFMQMVGRKALQLLLPCVTLTVLIYGTGFLTGFRSFPEFFAPDFTSVVNVLWFLKCVFLCYLIAYISLRLMKNVLVAALSTSVLFTLLPGADIVNLNFLLPVFWVGYGLSLNREWIAAHRRHILGVSGAAYLMMLYFWNGYLTVYSSPIAVIDWHTLTFDLPNLAVTVFRLAIGIAGSLALFTLAPWAERLLSRYRFYPWLLAAGRATLGIYVVQTLLVECGIHALGIYVTAAQSLIVAPALACVELPLCYMCVEAVRRSPIARLLLLGEVKAPALRLDMQP